MSMSKHIDHTASYIQNIKRKLQLPNFLLYYDVKGGSNAIVGVTLHIPLTQPLNIKRINLVYFGEHPSH